MSANESTVHMHLMVDKAFMCICMYAASRSYLQRMMGVREEVECMVCIMHNAWRDLKP